MLVLSLLESFHSTTRENHKEEDTLDLPIMMLVRLLLKRKERYKTDTIKSQWALSIIDAMLVHFFYTGYTYRTFISHALSCSLFLVKFCFILLTFFFFLSDISLRDLCDIIAWLFVPAYPDFQSFYSSFYLYLFGCRKSPLEDVNASLDLLKELTDVNLPEKLPPPLLPPHKNNTRGARKKKKSRKNTDTCRMIMWHI